MLQKWGQIGMIRPVLVEIHLETGREHGHHELLIRLHDHDLARLFLWSMEHISNCRGAKRLRVGQHLIMNMFTIEIFIERA
jgi:hypothetical protein